MPGVLYSTIPLPFMNLCALLSIFSLSLSVDNYCPIAISLGLVLFMQVTLKLIEKPRCMPSCMAGVSLSSYIVHFCCIMGAGQAQ